MSWPVMGSLGDDTSERSLLAGCSESLPALFSFVSRLVEGDQHQAEDIVQETLLRCWLKYGTADRAMLRPWLFTVARNLVIDAHRRSRARPVETEIDRKALPELCEAGPDDDVLSSVTLTNALRALAPAHREVLYRTYFLERTDEEVAADLGIPKGTVKSRRYYGLRALRLVLAEDAPGPVPA